MAKSIIKIKSTKEGIETKVEGTMEDLILALSTSLHENNEFRKIVEICLEIVESYEESKK